MKQEVPIEQAVGLRLAHDLTQIIPGSFKGVAFRKGHVVQVEDLPRLLDMGKQHVYVLSLAADEMHEDDAAVRMAQVISGRGIVRTEPHEGKVVLKAAEAGMLWVDSDLILQLNLLDDVSVTTRMSFVAVRAGESVAGVRPIPLTLQRTLLERFERIARTATAITNPGGALATAAAVEVWPFLPQRVEIVTTGSEVLTGRVVDKFGPVLRDKFAAFGLDVAQQTLVGDDADAIAAAIAAAVGRGATMVCVTGGMSVDPDDRTPLAIRRAADHVVTYGTPMLPGSMMMVAYSAATVLFGLPGAVIHDAVTAFDILLPRALAGWRFSKLDIARHGVGGWLHG